MAEAAVQVVPGLGQAAAVEQTRGETVATIGRGSLVFLGGMALAGASFLFERAVVRAVRKL